MESHPLEIFASGPAAADLGALLSGAKVTVLHSLDALQADSDRASLLILDTSLLSGISPARLRALPRGLVVMARSGEAERLAERAGRHFLSLPAEASPGEQRERLRAAALYAHERAVGERLRRERELAARDLFELSEIGGALMAPQETEELLATILAEARRVSGAEAGSLYLVEEERLRFCLMQNDALPELRQPDFTIPVDRSSFAGYAAATGETLRIADAYRLPPDAPYRFDRRFDEANGYRTRAVMVVPMRTPTGDAVGVLQLLNPRSGEFGSRDQQVARALGGQAAVSIENQRLRADIEALFEGFIRASVTALDQRDPGTSGHSVRVAELTCELAGRADGTREGPFAAIGFSREALRELRYAALLHDFGKVFVSEEVLGKDRKLPRAREIRVFGRFERAAEALEARFERERARYLIECGTAGFEAFEKQLRRHFEAEHERLRRFEAAVRRANEPRVLPSAVSEELQAVARHRVVGADAQEFPLLEDGDLDYLAVPQGNLTPAERHAIESHVTYTHRFLSQIPWTRDLAQVDAIASAHHEKLDGTGYPMGLDATAIPFPTRILTIADIFDALTAGDRPYKKALPLEAALEILHHEARRGRIDAGLLELFCATRVWRVLD